MDVSEILGLTFPVLLIGLLIAFCSIKNKDKKILLHITTFLLYACSAIYQIEEGGAWGDLIALFVFCVGVISHLAMFLMSLLILHFVEKRELKNRKNKNITERLGDLEELETLDETH